MVNYQNIGNKETGILTNKMLLTYLYLKDLLEKASTTDILKENQILDIALEKKGAVTDCEYVLSASEEYRQSQDVISEFMNEFYVSCPGAKVLNKTCVSEDFKRWHMETYNSKGPQPKEVYEYMDRKYGKPSGGKWINVKRKEIIIQEDEGDMDEVNDVDFDE